MDTNNEILDAIEILADKKIGDNITKVLTGICTSVNINKNTCVMNSNGVSGTVYFYGSPPEVNGLYRIFVPSNDMSRAFVIVPPRFIVNPNLLDNWYFGNPVNQKGQTEYTSNGYGMDRWNIGADVIVTDKYVTLRATGQYSQIFQPFDLQLAGKIVTMSALIKAHSNHSVGLLLYDYVNQKMYSPDFVVTPTANQWMLVSTSFSVVDSAPNKLNFIFYPDKSESGNQTVDILAAKLELGPTQTLGHLENGNWVLNEIPVYSDQLARCQRYMLQLVNTIDNYEILGGGAAMNTAQVFAFVPTPVSLFKKPFVLNRTGRFVLVRNTAASDGIPITSIGVDHVSSNGVSLVCTVDTSIDIGEYYSLWCVPNDVPNSLIISANL